MTPELMAQITPATVDVKVTHNLEGQLPSIKPGQRCEPHVSYWHALDLSCGHDHYTNPRRAPWQHNLKRVPCYWCGLRNLIASRRK